MKLFEFLKAVIFGIAEGVTEWLPVSSTGHMILLCEFVDLGVSEEFYSAFEVVIQLGAVLAVALSFVRVLSPFGKTEEDRKKTYVLWSRIAVATLPSAVAGVLFDDLLDTYLHGSLTVSAMLIFYGVAFILVERMGRVRGELAKGVYGLTVADAVRIGAFQVLALIPGTSRSGATVIGAMLMGVDRSTATEFSFFLAIPTMLGASALRVAKFFGEGNIPAPQEIGLLLAGSVTAFLVSLVTVRVLTNYVKKRGFTPFGIYRIILGVAMLAYFRCR